MYRTAPPQVELMTKMHAMQKGNKEKKKKTERQLDEYVKARKYAQ